MQKIKEVKLGLVGAGLILKIDTKDIYKKENLKVKVDTEFSKPLLDLKKEL